MPLFYTILFVFLLLHPILLPPGSALGSHSVRLCDILRHLSSIRSTECIVNPVQYINYIVTSPQMAHVSHYNRINIYCIFSRRLVWVGSYDHPPSSPASRHRPAVSA